MHERADVQKPICFPPCSAKPRGKIKINPLQRAKSWKGPQELLLADAPM